MWCPNPFSRSPARYYESRHVTQFPIHCGKISSLFWCLVSSWEFKWLYVRYSESLVHFYVFCSDTGFDMFEVGQRVTCLVWRFHVFLLTFMHLHVVMAPWDLSDACTQPFEWPLRCTCDAVQHSSTRAFRVMDTIVRCVDIRVRSPEWFPCVMCLTIRLDMACQCMAKHLFYTRDILVFVLPR